MIPLHFESRRGRLFGAYAPAAGPARGRGVVLCNPWGVEALRAHRSLKFLGDALARAGVDVLRFDYFGTGDSEGSAEDVTLSGCVEDTLAAMDELRDTAGIERVDLVGLRFGALVAGRAAAARSERRSRLVMWDPVPDGAILLRELLGGRPVNGAVEVKGFILPAALQEELTDAALEPPADGETLFALSSSRAVAALGSLAYAPRGETRALVTVEAPACWEEERDFGAGAVPVELLGRITAWL
jgi:pimeloyl-ACP methyl ester carboxylesterase